MLAVGGIALRLALTDAALNYIRPTYRPLLAVAGVFLVALGGTALMKALRRPHDAHHRAGAHEGVPAVGGIGGADHAAGDSPAEPLVDEEHPPIGLGGGGIDHGSAALADHAADGHGHDHGRGPRVAWLLAIPLFAVVLVAPPPLGSFAANRQSGVLQSTQTSYPPLPEPEDGAVPLTMGEYTVRALYDTGESLRGQRIRLTGFVSEVLRSRTEAPAGGRGAPDGGRSTSGEQLPDGYVLTRFALACCAADGTAIDVVVRGDTAPRLVDQWYEVEGTWEPRPDHVQGELTQDPPLLVAESVREIPQPSEPYEY